MDWAAVGTWIGSLATAWPLLREGVQSGAEQVPLWRSDGGLDASQDGGDRGSLQVVFETAAGEAQRRAEFAYDGPMDEAMLRELALLLDAGRRDVFDYRDAPEHRDAPVVETTPDQAQAPPTSALSTEIDLQLAALPDPDWLTFGDDWS